MLYSSVTYLKGCAVLTCSSERRSIREAMDWFWNPVFILTSKFESCQGAKSSSKTKITMIDGMKNA